MADFAETNYTKNIMPISYIHSYGLSMEENFQSADIYSWLQNHWHLTLPLVLVYVTVVHVGVKCMRDRPKLHLRSLLFFWNVLLTGYYVMGLYRSMPEIYYNLQHGEFYHLVCCHCPFGCTNVTLFWFWQFVWLKIPELLDTAFVILRKQPLFFLHWYHHCTVLVFTWYMASGMSSIGQMFGLVNAVVHALMYFYYAVKALSIRVPRSVSMALTAIQLSQMVFGVGTVLYAYRLKKGGIKCHVSDLQITVALVMYASYFCLFSWYFYKAYIVKDALIIAKFKGQKIN